MTVSSHLSDIFYLLERLIITDRFIDFGTTTAGVYVIWFIDKYSAAFSFEEKSPSGWYRARRESARTAE